MEKKIKEPKDLKVKVGTPLEVLWTNVKNNIEAEVKKMEDTILVNKELLTIAKLKIALEQKSRKV